MATSPELQAEPRTVFGKHVRKLRRLGLVPANIYGHGASRAIQAPLRAVEHVLAQGGRTGIVSIAVDGGVETALMKDIQRDPRSAKILHVEFRAVSLEELVTSIVPLRFTGEAPAVSQLDGVMTHPRSELHVTARARDLPDYIEIDVSGLDQLNEGIHVRDLPVSDKYKVLDPPEEVLAMVQPSKVAAEEEAIEAEAAEAAEAAVVEAAAEAAESSADGAEAESS
jgi:large subunit ribosomal protein L25